MPADRVVPRIDTRFGIPCLSLYGSSREMGFQYGKLLGNKLEDALSRVDGIKRTLLSLFPFYLRPFASLYFAARTLRAEKRIPADYIEELRGVAEGSGLPYGKILFASVIAETLIAFGCASILSLNKGRLLHSRNLDFFPPFLGSFPVVVNCHPQGKNPYTLVGFVGYLPGLTGMNSKGITLSLNESSCAVNKKPKKAALMGYTIRRVLEEASCLKDADRIVNSNSYTQGWTLAVGSAAEKNGAIFDIAGDAVFKNPLKPKKQIYSVNTFVNERVMKKYQCITRAGHAINHFRKTVLDRTAPLVKDTASAIRTLSDISLPVYGDILGDSTVNNYRTLQTVIMDPTRRTIVFSSAPAYAGLSAFYVYDIRADKMTLFRKSSARLGQKDMTVFIRWMECLYADPSDGLQKVLARKNVVPFQLEALFFLKDVLRIRVPWLAILEKTDDLLARYPGHPQLVRWKGEALFRLKRHVEAMELLLSLLECSDAAPNDRMIAHVLLAKCCRKLGMKNECSRHASTAKAFIERYASGLEEKRLIAELKSIVHILIIS